MAGARYQFGGSDILAAQIEQGARPDVYAAANTKLPAMLHAKGLLGTPVTFARNELVIAVPATSKITSIADLERAGTTLVIGSPTVPVGAYTRTVLRRLGSAAKRILANVRSQEPDVGGIVGKLTTGAADAGFTYVTDVKASHGKLRAVALPPSLGPRTSLAAAVVTGSRHAAAARAFVASLTAGAGQRALARRRLPAATVIRRAWFGAAGAVLLTVVLLFLALPVVAIFTHTTPGRLIARLGDPREP